MLLNGGDLDGARILAAKTVQQMTTPAVPPEVRFAGIVGDFVGPKVGTSWGLGFAIRTNPEFSILPGAVGSFNWSGLWGTYFWIDPVEKLIAVQMIQVPQDTVGRYSRALRHLTYAALRVPEPVSSAASAPAAVSADLLAAYVGKYDFGPSVSSKDKQAPFPAFGGTGLEFAVTDGLVIILTAYDSAPAAKAGLIAGDVISDVDNVSVKGLSLDQVIGKLRGPPGTQVRLRIVRKGHDNPIDFTIVRELIRLPGAQIEVRLMNGELAIAATGPWSVLDFEKDKPIAVRAISSGEFRVDGGDHTRIAFVNDAAGKVSGVVLNPGQWEIRAAKIN
jgi:hypothetical protein